MSKFSTDFPELNSPQRRQLLNILKGLVGKETDVVDTNIGYSDLAVKSRNQFRSHINKQLNEYLGDNDE